MAEGFVLSISDDMLKKLDDADKKIEKLQQTSEKTSAIVVNAFKQMATGVDPFINKLKEAQSFLSKMSAPNISIGGFSNAITDAEKVSEAVGNITVGLNKGLSVQEKERKLYIEKYSMYQRMFDSIEKQTKAQERLAQAEDRRNKRAQEKIQTKDNNAAIRAEEQYQKALNKTEITIVQRARKIEALANAERALLQTGRSYSVEINKIRTETERLNKANEDAAKSTENIKKNQRNLIDTSAQLERKLALLFSVFQIEGYIMKLVNIRGEFELQNRALQAILQNKDKADRLFDQITELAIHSPFRVKELVTYTKELAAYRIETEKLYDTTKMLADVSAGLGVDMSRLILAFGQVKAANYLRGTELRQFSEAGINILGELSTYFTELEGRVVSVGDVFERVTKRMVSFGDVEEIFKRITSAGGIFYNMQEIQAETLQGQISNLYDSIDIMFNEIGKANDGILKNTVALLRTMAENWESIANAIVPVITAFATYKGILLALIGYEKLMIALRTVSNKQLSLQSAMLVKSANGQTLFNIASKANPYLIVGSAIIAVITGIYYAVQSARKEQEKFNKTVSEGVVSANEMTANFKRLAEIATDSSKSTKEQNEALAELKRTYSDILPSQTLQIENLKAMKGNYDAVTTAIYAKIEAQTKEKLAQEIQNEYGSQAADATDKLIKKLEKFNISANASRTILAEFRRRFDEGFIKSPKEAQEELENLIQKFTFKDVKLTEFGSTGVWKNGVEQWASITISEVTDVFDSYDTLSKKMKEIQDTELAPFQVGGGTALYAQFKTELDDISIYAKKWKEDHKDELNPFELNEEAQRLTIAKYTDFIDDLSSKIKTGKFKNNDIEIANMAIERAQKAIDNFKGSKIQQEVKNIFMSFAQANNISLEGMDKLLLGSEEGLNEYSKRVKDLLTDFEERIALFNKNPLLSPYSKEQIELFKEQKPLLENQYSKTHVEAQAELNKQNKTAAQILKERISLIKETNKEYEKLLKNYSKEEAANKVRASYADTWKSLFKGTSMEGTIATMEFDVSGAISALETLIKTATGKMKIEGQKALDGLKAKVDLDVTVKRTEQVKSDIEKMFTGYEMYVELEKLNIPPDLAKQLFNVDVFNLDELKKRAKPYLDELKSKGEDQVKIATDIEKKISDMEYKYNVERLKKYSTYLKRTMSERVSIEMEAIKKINDINKIKEFTPAQKETAKEAVKKEAQIKIDKQEWSDFRDTDLYIKMFEDLDNVSTKTLKLMQDKLISLRNSLKELSPQELKEINKQIDAIGSQVISNNPFEGLKSNIKDFISYQKERKQLEEDYRNSITKESFAKEEYENQDRIVQTLEAQYNSLLANSNISEEEKDKAKDKLDIARAMLNTLLKQLVAQGLITKEYAKQIADGEKLGKSLSERFKEIGSYFNEFSSGIVDIASNLENVFGSMSSGTKELVDSITEISGGLGDAATGVGRVIANPADIGGYIQGLKGIATTIGAIFNIGDKKKERQINREIEKVEKLQKAYEKLEKSIDDAYSIDTLQASNKVAKENIQAQIASTERMIALEKDKKKTDNKRVEEWREQIEEMKQQLKELEEQRIESLGGFGSEANYKSAAQEFASAWYDAYKETGDGLSGLEDTFDSFIDNIVKKQLLLRGTQRLLDPLLDMIDQAVDDAIVSGDEMNNINEKWNTDVKPALDALYKTIADNMGIIGGESEKDLSGLQRGIQGITEDTALALESLLNSIRFFVSDSNLQLKNIYNMFVNVDAPNPILVELKMQTSLVRNIYDLFNGMTAPHPTLGKRGLLAVI